MNASTNAGQPPAHRQGARPYLGIYFECCHVYARVYRRADQPQYVARCPRCLRAAKIRVAADGSRKRMFIAH